MDGLIDTKQLTNYFAWYKYVQQFSIDEYLTVIPVVAVVSHIFVKYAYGVNMIKVTKPAITFHEYFPKHIFSFEFICKN